MTTPVLHTSFTPTLLRDLLLAAGYRVEEVKGPAGTPALRSATAGLAFEVHFANPLPNEAGDATSPGWADATFQAAFQVQGELPLSLVNHWNVSRRFARLNLLQNLLLLDMDIVALGGVSADNLRAQAEIWDRLVNQLIAYLRDELPKLAKAAPRAEPASHEGTAEPAVPDAPASAPAA